jgi:DNA-binding winged helix-turn-helix (wHTH) protein/predicted ATPase
MAREVLGEFRETSGKFEGEPQMAADRQFSFGQFRFDARTGELWRDRVEAKLTPRAAAVLCALAERAQELVTKQELAERVWGGMAVGDDALTSCVQELRGALGDDARHPRYIETRHRRGYRLMMPVTEISQRPTPNIPVSAPPLEPSTLVGRSADMEVLRDRLDLTLAGRRQVVLVTGEPGIGKSTLVTAFLDQLRARHAVRIALGQCLDHHGVGEPYLPLIEALTRLAGAPDGAAVKETLSAHAPSWLAQMPSLWTRSERAGLETRGRATRERMLRELTQAVEAMTADMPLLLWLEDIHWSDASTLDWLTHVARRPEPARLMVLATFRPADAAAVSAGLGGITAELTLHGHCHELSLDPLSLEAIESYLAARLGAGDHEGRLREIAPLLLERTGGNPLFMVSIVNQLTRQPSIAATPAAIVAIPHDVRRFIDRQIDELDPGDRDVLTAASVIRREFATAAVAAALESSIEQVETTCARLARHGIFIVKSGSTTWPDGTHADLYTFRHDLYRELLYDRLPASRRASSHAHVGRRLEAAWSGRLDMIAAELAEHFERGHELARAIPHHQRAAAKALRRSANEQAIGHLERALDAIGHVADEIERARVEIELRVALGAAFMAIRGFGAPEVLEAYARAEALCDRLGDRVASFPVLWGQWMCRTGRSEMHDARRLCTRLLALAGRFGDAGLELQAHHAVWATSFACGDLAEARAHAEAGLALYDAKTHQPMASSYGNHDAACCARNFNAMALALAGEDERARAMIEQALDAARTLDDPFSLALTLYFTSAAAQMLGDVTQAAGNSQLSVQIATEHDLALPRAWSMGVSGWCVAENGDPDRGIALLTQAIAAMQAMQSRHFMGYLLGLLADAHIKAGHHPAAMKVVEEGIAMADATGEHFYTAELHRLQGELCAHSSLGQKRKAEASFRSAIKLAERQGAHTLVRKASDSLHCRIGPR